MKIILYMLIAQEVSTVKQWQYNAVNGNKVGTSFNC